MTTWENAPNGKIVKTDVSVAKNYLREKELEEMGRIVNASLDMAESMAKRHIPMTMEDWAKRIDKFINLFESPILQDNGKVSAEFASVPRWNAGAHHRGYCAAGALHQFTEVLLRRKKACRLAVFFNNPKDGDSGKAGAPQRGGLPVRVSTTKAEGRPPWCADRKTLKRAGRGRKNAVNKGEVLQPKRKEAGA